MPQNDIPVKIPSGERGNWWRFTMTALVSGALATGGYAVAGARADERQRARIDVLEATVQHTLVPAVAALKTDTAVQARENQALRDGIVRLEIALRDVAADVKALRQTGPR